MDVTHVRGPKGEELQDNTVCNGASTLHNLISTRLQKSSVREFTDQVHLQGANVTVCANVFQLKDKSKTQNQEGSNEEPKCHELRQLEHKKQIDKVIDEWLKREKGSNDGGLPKEGEKAVFASTTLAVDFGLAMREPPLQHTVQLLILVVGRPFLLVTLYDTDKGVNEKEVREYSVRMCRLLTQSFHRFCSVDFVLLSCSIPSNDFTCATLTKEIDQRKTELQGYYGGPLSIKKTSFDELRKAVTVSIGVTSVPFYLEIKDTDLNEGFEWQLLMDKDWVDVFLLLTEMVYRGESPEITVSCTSVTEEKMKITFLEVARRLSFTDGVVVFTHNKQIQDCIAKILDDASCEHEIKLKLALEKQSEDMPSPRFIVVVGLPKDDAAKVRPEEGQRLIKLEVEDTNAPAAHKVSDLPQGDKVAEVPAAASLDLPAEPEILEWQLQNNISHQILKALNQQGFTSMETLRLLKSKDVTVFFKDVLQLADCLVLEKAIAELPKASQMQQHDTFRILLAGKSGSGKSSTGNTIIGKDVFSCGTGMQGVTKICEHKCKTQRNGSTIEVTDSPGLFDLERKEPTRGEMLQTLASLDPGPTAILYVVRIGRYTKEDFETYQRLIELFGKEIRKYITIVFTCGDLLKKDHQSAETYILKAGEMFLQVLRECGNRYVVFNNKDSKRNRKASVKELFEKLRQNMHENGHKPFRCTNQEIVSEHIGDLVRDTLRQSGRLKEFDRKIQCVRKETEKDKRDRDETLSKLQKLIQKQEEWEKREINRSREFRETTHKEMAEIKRSMAQQNEQVNELAKQLKKKVEETTKLYRQKESAEKFEEAEARKNVKADVIKGHYDDWSHDIKLYGLSTEGAPHTTTKSTWKTARVYPMPSPSL